MPMPLLAASEASPSMPTYALCLCPSMPMPFHMPNALCSLPAPAPGSAVTAHATSKGTHKPFVLPFLGRFYKEPP